MGIVNHSDCVTAIEVNPVTLQALINATYAVLAENNVKITSKLEKLEDLLLEIEDFYLKDLNDD